MVPDLINVTSAAFAPMAQAARRASIDITLIQRNARSIYSTSSSVLAAGAMEPLKIDVTCHPEVAMLFGGRRISAVALRIQQVRTNCRDASLRSA
jgi:hypothetical protein